jgi:thiosulfate/3-mercaptopyruvate sulfurtransferase
MDISMGKRMLLSNRWIGILTVAIFGILLPVMFFCRTFAHAAPAPDLTLIGTNELSRSMQNWVILDARPKLEWQAGRIAGAHSFSWNDYTGTDKNGKPFCLKPPEELALALAGMGINENTPIVVYGDADKSWGGEGWACWLLSWLGHNGPIRLLAGGIQAWRDQKGPVELVEAKSEQAASKPARYRVNLRTELEIQTIELEQKANAMVLIDTRSTAEWLLGHIPGAIHINWTDFYTGEDRHPLDPEALKKLLKEHGADMSKPVVYYCAGGVRSAYTWTIHHICGLPPARNYYAGMEDWKRRPSQ